MFTAQEIKQNREAWIAALRSGRYQQSPGLLRTVHEDGSAGFCPLGVACEISGLGFWIDEITYQTFTDASAHQLPDPVKAALGLDEDPAWDDFVIDVMHLNDKPDSFNEIADLIEEYFQGQ